MSILTSIDGIPLFRTEIEAVEWAKTKGLTGFHTHKHNNQIGYMGGLDHNQVMASSNNMPDLIGLELSEITEIELGQDAISQLIISEPVTQNITSNLPQNEPAPIPEETEDTPEVVSLPPNSYNTGY